MHFRQGGMIILTPESFQQLQSYDGQQPQNRRGYQLSSPPAVVMHFGDYMPADGNGSGGCWYGTSLPAAMYMALIPELEGRLGLMGPLRGADKVGRRSIR